jgi:biopolymer transport protein ExbB
MNIETLFHRITALGTLWILWTLVALSVVGAAIIIERSACYWSSRDDIKRLSEQLGECIANGRWERLRKVLSESPSFEARVAIAALDRVDPQSANEHMLSAIELVRLELERYLAFLATVGSNAPFVGLLGTVIGIVGAFGELDASGGALTEGLMTSVGEALIATAVGLLVALPAIGAFNVFRRIVQTRVARADALRRTVLGHLLAQRTGAR